MLKIYHIGIVCGLAALVLLPEKAESADQTARPNILWLTCEDNNIDWVGCYGNPRADTPNIDRLASEGFQYMHCYANAPVCAPSRSTWITGMLAISNGTFPMRSRNEIPHDRIQYYPDLLKDSGYYTGNDRKTDYNIGGRKGADCWDNPGKVDWDALRNNQPFFQIINDNSSHESKAQGDVENTRHEPDDVRLRAYHPDLPDVRKNYAKYHDAMKNMDTNLGAALRKLEAMGLAENTIVIHNSDHGGVLPRSKRYLFQSGIHCPLIIRIPERFRHLWPAETPGSRVDRLVSFVDMPKTWLSLTGSEVPDYMQGTVFLGSRTEPEPDFHFAFRGRMDERIDNARAICDKQFLYIRNYMPYAPWMQHLQYLWKMKATQAWDEHVRSGSASEMQARFFQPKGWTEELYDMRKDPDNVNNLIADLEYRPVVEKMRAALRARQLEIVDTGLLPESEMVQCAKNNGLTIYDMARDPALYPLSALLDAADLALAEKQENLPALRQLLESENVGLRYWGLIGCFLLNDREAGEQCLEDPSHEVRAMAAWLLTRTGAKSKGTQCLEALLEQQSYAALTVLNIIDWMDNEGRPLLPAVKAYAPSKNSNEERMTENLLDKFSAP